MSDDYRTFAAGAVIFREGDPGDFMYIVKNGEVEIRVHDRTVDVLKPDAFFGEMSLIDAEPRSATAIAKTDCVLEPVNQRRFAFMVQQTPYFAMRMLKAMSHLVRRQNRAL
jgi:CRP-like cAMP-binding protein